MDRAISWRGRPRALAAIAILTAASAACAAVPPTSGGDQTLPAPTTAPDVTVAAPTSTTIQALPASTTWRFNDTRTDLGTGWRASSFNDTAWKSGTGSFGAGDSGLTTAVNVGPSGDRTPTVYFRTTVPITGVSTVTGVKLRLQVDDGAVVYVNGTEAARDNMPSGTIGYGTWATTFRDGAAETATRTLTIPAARLVEGPNVIAIELHQAWKTSSDLRLKALGLDVTYSAAGPAVTTTVAPATTVRPTTTVAPTTTAAPTTTTAPPTTTTAAPPTTPGWNLVFADEFNGTTLNTNIWRPYHSTYGDGNRELQCHTPSNVAVSGGYLAITSRRQQYTCPGGSVREFTSGFLGTRENGVYFPRYGRYEFRGALPHGQGLWPAFWLRHRNGASAAEIDVMEYFHSEVPGRTTGTVHYNGVSNVSKKHVFFEAPTTTPQFHTWAVEMEEVTPGGHIQVRWYLDNVQYHSYTITNRVQFEAYAGQNLFDIAVNMSVGGNWTGHPDDTLGWLANLGRWTNADPADIWRATFPSTMLVDYVRVYTR